MTHEKMMLKLDTAMLHDLCLFVVDPDHSTKLRVTTLIECEGIALSAFWLDLIDSNEFSNVCSALSACRQRIENGK